jgi:putative DNA primase/helicase
MSERVPLTLADLPELLQYISADDRETWLQVGMGIKAEFGGAGFDAWDTWSATGEGYKAADAQAVWRSFRKAGTGMGTVIKLARDKGWSPRREPMSAEEKRQLNAEAEKRRAARQAEIEADEARLAVMREAVAQACELIWTKHCKPQGDSPYLARKQVGAFGVGFFHYTVVLAIDDARQRCDVWVGSEVREFFASLPKPRPDSISFLMFKAGTIAVPLRDAAGKLWSLQAINEQGTKLFPRYGRKAGCFHVLGEPDGAPVLGEAEGYATAASVHMAMGWPVAVAIDSGNLPAVAAALRDQCPAAQLVIAGDDDPSVAGNPGRAKAEAAAGQVGGLPAFPVLPGEAAGGDWNDLHVGWGLEAVTQQLEAALAAGVPSPAPSEADAAAPAGSSDTGGQGVGFTAEQVLRRFALVEGTTHVWDQDKKAVMKKTAFEALVTKPLAKAWADDVGKKLIGADTVRELEQARRMAGKKATALGMTPIDRYVYIDGTKDVWDREKKRRIPEGAVKMALGDAYALWLNSAERRTVDVDHIVFDPTMTKDPATYINTFEGLPLEPVRDDAACENLRWLIAFLCNHDGGALDWLTKWLAFPLQYPGAKMDTAVLMHSVMEGSGKSLFFADTMGALYGQYAATVGQTQLESNFNAWQSRKLWAVFEEVVSRDQRYNQVGKIKHLITGKTVRMESKFINGWEEANHMNAVFLSNEILPWPISDSDRRLLVMWPQETLPPERQQAIGRELANGGVAALYAWLLAVDLGDFNERTRPPHTDARQRLVALSRAGWQTFLHQWRTQELGRGLWGGCLSSDLYSLFLEWCQRNREHAMSQTKFSLFISSEVEKTARPIPWTDGNSRRFGAFFIPDDPNSSLPPSLTSAALGQMVKDWRAKAREAGWDVDGWDHVKGKAA